MLNTLIGTKGDMSQTFEDNSRVALTAINIEPCVITQIKDEDKDGYSALQIGTQTRPSKNTTKQLQGHLKKAKQKEFSRYIKEVESPEDSEFKVGDVVTLQEVFTKGDTINVTATSKGKGFQGGVKRWGFAGGPKTHGQSDRHRAPGSIGQGTDPGRVWKGKKMAGHMGVDTVTVKNLKVVKVDETNNLLFVSGPVPGAKGALVTVKRTSELQVKPVETEQKEDNNENHEN